MATTNNLKDNQSNVIVGLGTYVHTVKSTNMYFVNVQVLEVPPSSIVISILQNGTPVVTSSAPAAAQMALNLQKILNCTAGDVISVSITSSSVLDKQLNTVKSIIIIHQGLN